MTPKNLIAFPSVPWSHNWERQHEFIYRMSDEITGSAWIHPPLGLINHSFGELVKKIRNRLDEKQENGQGFNPTSKNMRFLSTRILPFHYICPIDKFNAGRILSKTPGEIEDSLVYATYANGAILDILKKAPGSILDLAQRRQVSEKLSQRAKETERNAVKMATWVFADSMATCDDYRKDRPDIIYLPQGCDPDRFSGAMGDEIVLEKAKEYKGVIGYAGTDIVMNYPLLLHLINSLPEYLFVLVGDLKRPEGHDLTRYPNVYLPGRQPFEKLGSFYASFDLGLIPYERTPHTDGVFPTKYFEYHSAGIPVLSTKLPDLVALEGPGTSLSDNMDEWPDLAIQLMSEGWSDRDELRNFAAQNSWDARFEQMWQLIESKKQ